MGKYNELLFKNLEISCSFEKKRVELAPASVIISQKGKI